MPLDYTLTIPSNLQFNFTPFVPHVPATLNRSLNNSISISSGVSSGAIKKDPSSWQILQSYFHDLVTDIHFFFHSFFYPAIENGPSQIELRKNYLGLREFKWKESVDGCHHVFGKLVYDQGLHGSTKEPGFIQSVENAHRFVSGFLGRKIDAKWYLRLHKVICGHFKGESGGTLMGQEKVGMFRTIDDSIGAHFPQGVYQVTVEALQEFNALDIELKNKFGIAYGLGYFEDRGGGAKYLYYKRMTREQVTQIFNYFLSAFYFEVQRAQTSDQKLQAIARLHQRLEWLHPVRDGTSRTSLALMNKLLTDYGFHPAILEYPHVSSSYGLIQWTQYLKNGLRKWEDEKARLSLQSN